MAIDPAQPWNPHYLAYCRAHGFADDPEGMQRHDAAHWPGGANTGFILWISQQRTAFAQAHPEAMRDAFTIGDQRAWGAFLQAQATVQGNG